MNSLFREETKTVTNKLDIATLHALQCKACPLALVKENLNPDMKPTGAARPLIYVLGEGPGRQEDEEAKQFIGESGRMLRSHIPGDYKSKLRFNNVVRTRPPDNRNPTWVEIECCRPSIIKDIEQTKPRAIFGFGNVPLEWVCGFTGITVWRGRKMPVKIGTHSCWYYPMLHPAFLLRRKHSGDSISEDERVFGMDIERACAEIEYLPQPIVHTSQDVWRNVNCITDSLRDVEEALRWAAGQSNIGLDYETNRLRPYSEGAKLLTAAVGNDREVFAFPFDHPEAVWTPKERKRLAEVWCTFLWAPKPIKFVHNLAFELEWTGVMFGTEYVRAGKWECTAANACILDERKGKNKPGCFSLEFLVQLYFGINLKKLSNVDLTDLENTPLDVVLRYNGGDARGHCWLGVEQRKEIAEEELQEAALLAQRRVPTVVLTQIKGVPVNQKECTALRKKYGDRLKDLYVEIAAVDVVKKFAKQRGQAFKPLSNPDVLYVFKDMLGCEECAVTDKYSKKVKYSADEEVLAKIDHLLARLLLQLRKANKRKSTYIDPLYTGPREKNESKNCVVYPDNLTHAIFNTIFSEAGRLSCEDPNWQNVPKRDDEAKELRKQVTAKKGHVILAVDYGQIEARVIAMFTKDKNFCKALWERYDVHMEWAKRVAMAYPARIGGKKNLTDKGVMKTFRTDIKNQWTFPLFFGAQLDSVAGYLNIPAGEIEDEYEKFWDQFSGVKQWQEDLLDFYRKYGYVECLTGRRRRAPLRLNQVINSPVQGTAAEIVMDGMCRVSEIGDMELQPNINIHDDLTYCDVPVERVDDIAERVIHEMLAVPFPWVNVPITVEASIGPNWLEMEEFGTFSSDTWSK